jgi:hypothetical protein
MDAVFRVLIALAIGVVILRLGLWGVRLLAMPGPTEPDPDDVVEVERTFVCRVCGMQLTVTYAQDMDVEPPRHCREEMVPV